jgi:hypothetical protein
MTVITHYSSPPTARSSTNAAVVGTPPEELILQAELGSTAGLA